jgi:hypothetical protein
MAIQKGGMRVSWELWENFVSKASKSHGELKFGSFEEQQ